MALAFCSICKENSVKTKVYIRKRDGVKTRVEFCINKGCGYNKELSFHKGIYLARGVYA